MTPEQIEGVTKARLLSNLDRVSRDEPLFDDNAAYMAWVTESVGLKEFPLYAADSYAEQHAGVDTGKLGDDLALALESVTAKEDQAMGLMDAAPVMSLASKIAAIPAYVRWAAIAVGSSAVAGTGAYLWDVMG